MSITRRPKGRGAPNNPANRFHTTITEPCDDDWTPSDPASDLKTERFPDASRTVISYNRSPDVPFDRSINPYRGCEHGCIYCFARPSHAYLDCSPGLDFETHIFYKPEAPERLNEELGHKNYRCQPIALGVNTDAYQPVERHLGITRRILEVLDRCHHPVSIITKSALIERDIDLLRAMAERNLCQVMISITTLDRSLARRMEPRAAAPQRRLETLARLRSAGIPTGVLLAPVIPMLNDHEIETLLSAAHQNGAMEAGYVMIRLPHEVETLFHNWLDIHYPLKAARIMNRIRDLHDGKTYDARFGQRMTGSGIYAKLIKQRFDKAVQRLGFTGMPTFDCTAFRPDTPQMSLF